MGVELRSCSHRRRAGTGGGGSATEAEAERGEASSGTEERASAVTHVDMCLDSGWESLGLAALHSLRLTCCDRSMNARLPPVAFLMCARLSVARSHALCGWCATVQPGSLCWEERVSVELIIEE